MPGLIAAAIFSFITSFDEFFISQFLSSVDTVTLPVQVFNVLQYDVDPSRDRRQRDPHRRRRRGPRPGRHGAQAQRSGQQDGLLPTEPGMGLRTGSEPAP